MDRLNQLRAGAEAGAGRGGDDTLDTSTPPSEAYMSANESSSKYFSLSDSTFDISPIKDVSLASAASTADPDHNMTDQDELLSNLSAISKKDVMLDSFKIDKPIEAANILSGGVDIFDDNDNSFDGDELVIDDNVDVDEKTSLEKESQLDEAVSEATLVETPVDVASKDTEVVLQIDGKNVDAIDIGNGLYLYRKAGKEELAAVQIITEENQQPSFKFLKVRENAEGNLEVYEEFEIEVSKDVPISEAKPSVKNTPHVPIKDIKKIITESSTKVDQKRDKMSPKEVSSTSTSKLETEVKEPESKTELNLNGKMMKFSESRKSPVVGSFTPMTYHSTPNKEGKPLTKTMVDLQLHPSRHSDNVKKTIEVHTDSQTKKLTSDESKPKAESPLKKNVIDNITKGVCVTDKETTVESNRQSQGQDANNLINENTSVSNADKSMSEELKNIDQNSTKDVDKVKLDDITKVGEDHVNPVKVMNENKPQEQETFPPKTTEIEVKEADNKEKDVVISKPTDSIVSTDKTHSSVNSHVVVPKLNDPKISTDKSHDLVNLVGKNLIFASLLGPTRVNQVLRSNTTKIEGPSVSNIVLDKVIDDTEKVSVKNDDKLISKLEVKKDELEIHPKDVNKFLETSKTKENEQLAEQKSETKIDTTIPNQDQLKKDVHEQKSTEFNKVLETPKIKQSEQKAENSETKIDTIIPNLDTATTEPKTELKLENMIYREEKRQETLLKVSETSVPKQNESKADVKAVQKPDELNIVSKDIEIKTTTEINKIIPIATSIETVTGSQEDKATFVTKPGEQTILPIIEKIDPVTKIETTITSTVDKTNILEKKVESKTTISKKVDTQLPLKTGTFNPTGKLIGCKPFIQSEKAITINKVNEPKTSSKTDKLNPITKAIEPKAALKVYHLNPIAKGLEPKTVSKTVMLNPVSKAIEPKISSKLDKAGSIPSNQNPKNKAVIITSNRIIVPSKVESLTHKEINIPQVTSHLETKPLNNNHTAVPFGQWTDANRQEFLNKFKEIKVPATSSTKQIKNSNDLNRIDILKKIDSQRCNTAKAQDKLNIKDTVFSSKIPQTEMKIPVKNDGLKVKPKQVDNKNNTKLDVTETVTSTVSSNVSTSDVPAPVPEERREVNVNDLIGKAIVDMLNRPVAMPMTRSPLDEPRQVERDVHVNQTEISTETQKLNVDHQKPKAEQQKLNIDVQKMKIDQKLNIDQQKLQTDPRKLNTEQLKLNMEQKTDEDSSGSLDDIEMKMNELHGIPFVERPPHELPKVHKTYSKSGKDKNQSKGARKLLPASSKQILVQDNNVIELESDDEVIEHEPITGDIDLSKKAISKLPAPVKTHIAESKAALKETRKEPVITENEFDKFARRNSITYEDCLTVKFDGKEPANLVQTVKEKDASRILPRHEMMRIDAKTKLPHKQSMSQINASKYPNTKFGLVPEDPNNKNYHSKIHTAYQSALTAKLQMDRPIIEDKPVKVVFMDTNAEFVPNQLNVQGKELSPAKKASVEIAQVSPQLTNADALDSMDDKQQDDTKTKTKHQRKQVLNPVETPELELIQPRDLGLDVSPKKKRKTDDNKTEKSLKNLVHKKSYLLGRTVTDEKRVPEEVINPIKETIICTESMTDRTVSAIDNLVKAAELLENQSVQSASPNPDSQQVTPLKRGRGRPRKCPLPEGCVDKKIASPSPQKKPRLIDAKPVKPNPVSDIESSDEEQMIRENWTMGKINENIVCPICNKLFRSENVVFKHVKHCTGVSPTRSDLEKRSPRRRRHSSDKSFESESEDMDLEDKPKQNIKSTPKKRKSKESLSKNDAVDIIIIEDTPVKESASKRTEDNTENLMISKEQPSKVAEEKPKRAMEEKQLDREPTLKELADEKHKSKKLEEDSEEKSVKMKKIVKTTEQRSSNLVCEFCGKTFRQASYLANHKLQHKKEQTKKLEAKLTAKLQVFSCEVCKKEFRKLHHLVQHRLIHNPEVPTRTKRKSSSEQSEPKVKETPAPKQNDDTSAGFRCEPCDKSFRKLHHLVEHRETHDGKNRQKTNVQTTAPPAQTIEKPPPPPQCDVCKKIFRKLHHLIEHKEQHHVEQVETSSEKSDDKSVQSSLSTRDIIHECSLCYMVFPNEHSLNKHFVICQQKKRRQSKTKDKPKNQDGTDVVDEITTEESMDAEDAPKIIAEEIIVDDVEDKVPENKSVAVAEKVDKNRVCENPTDVEKKEVDNLGAVSKIPVPKEDIELKSTSAKRDLPKSDDSPDVKMVVPEKIKKVDDHVKLEFPKKSSAKDKVAPRISKRQKSTTPLSVLPEDKSVESNDDDEVRYMLNPNFKVGDTSEGKVFMKVRANKRNSLQIERPISKDLFNRRTSLQHPPKIPRMKAKAVEPKIVPTVAKNIPKTIKTEAASTDSDDSDVKYAFPETVAEVILPEKTPKEKKAPRKPLVEKRKSLSGIAKRKSMGQAIVKPKVDPLAVRIIKRRTLDVEYRCDCGQLFNSAALLTRHTSLAHTPPRIRRRRSPPPEVNAKPTRKSIEQPTKSTRKSCLKTEASNSKPNRKSSAKSDSPDTRKSIRTDQSQEKNLSAKPKRNAAHRGVPVPENMRKLMLKIAK